MKEKNQKLPQDISLDNNKNFTRHHDYKNIDLTSRDN